MGDTSLKPVFSTWETPDAIAQWPQVTDTRPVASALRSAFGWNVAAAMWWNIPVKTPAQQMEEKVSILLELGASLAEIKRWLGDISRLPLDLRRKIFSGILKREFNQQALSDICKTSLLLPLEDTLRIEWLLLTILKLETKGRDYIIVAFLCPGEVDPSRIFSQIYKAIDLWASAQNKKRLFGHLAQIFDRPQEEVTGHYASAWKDDLDETSLEFLTDFYRQNGDLKGAISAYETLLESQVEKSKDSRAKQLIVEIFQLALESLDTGVLEKYVVQMSPNEIDVFGKLLCEYYFRFGKPNGQMQALALHAKYTSVMRHNTDKKWSLALPDAMKRTFIDCAENLALFGEYQDVYHGIDPLFPSELFALRTLGLDLQSSPEMSTKYWKKLHEYLAIIENGIDDATGVFSTEALGVLSGLLESLSYIWEEDTSVMVSDMEQHPKIVVLSILLSRIMKESTEFHVEFSWRNTLENTKWLSELYLAISSVFAVFERIRGKQEWQEEDTQVWLWRNSPDVLLEYVRNYVINPEILKRIFDDRAMRVVLGKDVHIPLSNASLTMQ